MTALTPAPTTLPTASPTATGTILVQGTPPVQTPAPGEGGDGAGTGSLFDMMMPFLLIGLVMWFLIFRPEKMARKQRQEMLGALKKGDKIVTTGGLHAKVVDLRENEVTLEAGNGRFVYSRSAVAEVVGKDGGQD